MIRLITGLPGAGKSLRGVQLIRKFLDEGRNVYVDGLDGLQPFGWQPCNAREWEALPDGSVIVVDEAQKVWPTRRAGDTPPDIRALSEHRHHGLDFVLLTQHPTMLDAYVRKLVGQHEHIVRQFGMQASRIITWTECQDDPQSLGTRQRGTDALWKYPTECYPLYKSATLHTVKRRIPFRVKMLPVLVIAAIGSVVYGWKSLSSLSEGDPASVADPTLNARKVGEADAAEKRDRERGGEPRERKYRDAADYAQAFLPRIAAQPWSAPAFDQREPRTEPELLCVNSEAKGCQCYTEQVTRVFIDKASCLRTVAYGSYNPFRAPAGHGVSGTAVGGQGAPPAAVAPPRVYEELPVPRSAAHVRRDPINPGSVWPVRR